MAQPEPDALSFAAFWQAYGKKEDKHKAGKAWAALSLANRAAAMAQLVLYVAATPERRYRKNPLTYLNGRCWLDEDVPGGRAPVVVPPEPAAFPNDPHDLWNLPPPGFVAAGLPTGTAANTFR